MLFYLTSTSPLICCQKYRKQEFDTELEDFEEQSVWDSEDEWTSEDGGEGGQNADTSGVAEQSE